MFLLSVIKDALFLFILRFFLPRWPALMPAVRAERDTPRRRNQLEMCRFDDDRRGTAPEESPAGAMTSVDPAIYSRAACFTSFTSRRRRSPMTAARDSFASPALALASHRIRDRCVTVSAALANKQEISAPHLCISQRTFNMQLLVRFNAMLLDDAQHSYCI